MPEFREEKQSVISSRNLPLPQDLSIRRRKNNDGSRLQLVRGADRQHLI